jgi:hypothetical protein
MSYDLHDPGTPHATENVPDGPLRRDIDPDLLGTEPVRMRAQDLQDALP